MDQKWKTYNLGWLKNSVVAIGILLMIAAIALFFAASVIKAEEQTAPRMF